MPGKATGETGTGDRDAEAASTAGRLGACVLHLVLEATSKPVRSLQQLEFVAPPEELDGFTPRAGQDLMLDVAARPGRPFRRRYTIRSFDPATGRLTMQVVLHGDGPGMRWAREVQPGTEVIAIGPRGKIWPVDDAPWHGFIGDAAFLPAASAMIEGRPSASRVWALIEVDGPDEELPPADAATRVMFVHRNGRPPGDDAGLLSGLANFDMPRGDGHIYVGGELRVVAAIRRRLLDQGFADDQLSTKPYWRRGRPNQPHGEPEKD